VEGTTFPIKGSAMAMRYYAPYPGAGGEPFGGRGHQSFRVAAPHTLRVGDAERDATAADLAEHFVAGRLTLDELHNRLDAVFGARTYGQLTRIMADLPRLRPVSLPPGVFPPPHSERRNATPSDRAGRFAALSLLILAMLIWLLTALLFARHGIYYQVGPPGPR
jgi:Domain of unknown function (DUF1707)